MILPATASNHSCIPSFVSTWCLIVKKGIQWSSLVYEDKFIIMEGGTLLHHNQSWRNLPFQWVLSLKEQVVSSQPSLTNFSLISFPCLRVQLFSQIEDSTETAAACRLMWASGKILQGKKCKKWSQSDLLFPPFLSRSGSTLHRCLTFLRRAYVNFCFNFYVL